MYACRWQHAASSIRLPVSLVGLIAVLILSGCGSPSRSSANGAVKSPAKASDSPAAVPRVGSPSLPDAPGSKPGTTSQMVSTIAGDRISVIPTTVVLSKQPTSSPFRFAEIAKEAGIDFVHFSGMTEEKHFPTANGSGVAVFDYNNDGLLDIYFATATLLPLGTAEKGPNRLYKNLGGNRFRGRDPSLRAGLSAASAMASSPATSTTTATQDVFLCNYGSNVLYLNNGDGTFKDISKQAGIDAPNWSSGGAMLDYDNDGFLDIYVTNYGRWIYPEDHHQVGDNEKKIWLYSSPRTIKTVKHLFYHNNRNRTFTDVFDKVITIGAARWKTRRPRPRRRCAARAPRRRPRFRRRDGRSQQRRPDRHLRRQRHEPQLLVLEPR